MELKYIETKTHYDEHRKAQVKCDYYLIGHYRVIRGLYTYDTDGYTYTVIDIQIKEKERFIPSIYVEDDMDNTKTNLNGFRIQTTAYGALETEEIDEVIKGFKEAQEVVQVLKETFMKEGD